jgi:hypothetical protein
MKKRLWDVARVLRSKNSGPFELTLDVIFPDEATFEAVREQGVITRERISALYRLPMDKVRDIIWFRSAKAVKITMARRVPSGDPGDTDVYGAQQYAPLYDVEIDV